MNPNSLLEREEEDYEDNEYEVDKILTHRVNKDGQIEYLIRWKPSWQHASALAKTQKIRDFELDRAEGKHKLYSKTFHKAKVIEIMEAKEENDDLLFLVKFDNGAIEIVPAAQLIDYAPDLVIQFYENRVVFYDEHKGNVVDLKNHAEHDGSGAENNI